jgi:hypothetical protein
VRVSPGDSAGGRQYQIVTLPQAQGQGRAALILDTKNGHLWEWASLPDMRGVIMNSITYQGQMAPGQSFFAHWPITQNR